MPYKDDAVRKAYHIEYNRRHGHKPRSLVTEPSNKKGYDAEVLAKNYFESLGYSVIQSTQHGPDLILTMDERTTTVEVKSCIKAVSSWCVHQVKNNRKQDDLIAIVMPNGFVYVDTMKHHLLACTKSGKRTVTCLVNKYGR